MMEKLHKIKRKQAIPIEKDTNGGAKTKKIKDKESEHNKENTKQR